MTVNTLSEDVTISGERTGALLASRYRIVRQLGQGGMGSVWLAEDTQLDNKLFAIKMLPSILVSNKRAYNQLKSEALVAMKLVHPNIVQIRAFEENNGNPFLLMDYIDGETLDDYLANRMSDGAAREDARPPENIVPAYGRASVPASRIEELSISEEEVIRLLKPIAEALDYAHTEGVVHRDIKPANVMIRKDGRPFIMDFGIAREIQETMTRVTGKISSGTLMYMSPEQLHGAEPTKEQDVYSFAAMAYECLMGRPPFHRGQIEYQIDHDEPTPLPSATGLSEQVLRGLSKDPQYRPDSCSAVLQAVRKRDCSGDFNMPVSSADAKALESAAVEKGDADIGEVECVQCTEELGQSEVENDKEKRFTLDVIIICLISLIFFTCAIFLISLMAGGLDGVGRVINLLRIR